MSHYRNFDEKLTRPQRRLLHYIRRHGGEMSSYAEEHTGCCGRAFDNVLGALERRGLIRFGGREWALTDRGEEACDEPLRRIMRREDDPKAPQAVRIAWELVLKPDASILPDELDAGFWPSTDPDAAGYVPPEHYDKARVAAEERMAAFKRGKWHYVGVIARAHIAVPIGGGSFTSYTMDSSGVWGIESDADDYLNEVFEEQKAELLTDLVKIGKAASAAKES